jgi:hypothetical protein
MTSLTDDEREHIRLTEMYRNEVRRQSESGRSFWKEKVFAPAGLIIFAGVVSGLVVPFILRVDEESRRAAETKARAIAQLASDSAAAQMAMVRYNEQLCDYWNAALRLELRKRNLARTVQTRDSSDVGAEREAINSERSRENALRIEVDKEYADARVRLAVATERLHSGLRLYYGDNTPANVFVDTINTEVLAINKLLNETHQDKLAEHYRYAKTQLQLCASDDACRAIVDHATSQVEKIREATPSFDKWKVAAYQLSDYILNEKPQAKSRTALASMFGAANE